MAKAKKKSSFLRVLVVLLLVGLLASFGYYLIKQSLVLSQQEAQIARMQEENARLEDEYRKVLEKIDDKNTVEFVEQYMRSHFGMIRNGETRIDVVEGE